MTVTKDWREGYRAALIEFVFAQGTPVDPSGHDHYFGYIDPDWVDTLAHVKTCKPVVSDIREVSYRAFEDTFSGDRTLQAVDVIYSCSCGAYFDRSYRWEGSVGEIFTALLKG